MQVHFISGLPRSGSTLLAAILRQNIKFYASIMTPVGRLLTTMHQALSVENEGEPFITDNQRYYVLKSIVEAYFLDSRSYVNFLTDRRWCANAALLYQLFPESRIICMVRSLPAVIDSFEKLHREHPLTLSKIIGCTANTNVYQRVDMYMQDDAVVGFAWNGLKDAFYGPHRSKLYLIEYDMLARRPDEVMAALHEELGLEPFVYDFDHIEPIPGAAEFDRRLGAPDLHALKSKVSIQERDTILPPDIVARLPRPFWRVSREVTKRR